MEVESIWIILSAILGSMGAYWISISLNKGGVLGSAIVTLLSGILFPRFFSEMGHTLALVATAGSYAGMVSKKNVPNILEMAFIGAFVGIIFILSSSAYVGLGGRLGTMAAISCLAWLGLKQVYRVGIDKLL